MFHCLVLVVVISLADKLEVTHITGGLGEEMPLYSPLEACPSATTWLSNLEQHMKTTVQTLIEACVQTRLDEGMWVPYNLKSMISDLKTKLYRVQCQYSSPLPLGTLFLLKKNVLLDRYCTKNIKRDFTLEAKSLYL